ncbi:MAG TPA: metal-dependent transcriptional regulator [Methanomassiliicoccales archaeon]|nr:metal-dependent transcriptional regulator [Methanomassiliicoccales archaeon]HNX47119.1 metal-dependent transcriptional regulator [Methanomassiliicoccales archaeon]HPR98891.1 metal-dependent transcriptional regulator [Methanomassiliicoccales archaeon]HSA35441.1 metal-dependent transcriptional regulator [Methanomassiliicoccales archaeon]
MVSENIEEYLECIWELTQDGTPARTTDIAKKMKVSPASVTEMMQRLDSLGYIVYEKYKGVTLTDSGNKIGETIKRKHRLLERFLVDVLGIANDKSHEEACRLEHMLSDESERRISKMMNNPTTCPDGDPIPALDQLCLNKDEDSSVLSELSEGDEGIISHLSCDDPQKIRRVIAMGFVPERCITVEEKLPLGGPVLVQVGDCRVALAKEYSDLVFVNTRRHCQKRHRHGGK